MRTVFGGWRFWRERGGGAAGVMGRRRRLSRKAWHRGEDECGSRCAMGLIATSSTTGDASFAHPRVPRSPCGVSISRFLDFSVVVAENQGGSDAATIAKSRLATRSCGLGPGGGAWFSRQVASPVRSERPIASFHTVSTAGAGTIWRVRSMAAHGRRFARRR